MRPFLNSLARDMRYGLGHAVAGRLGILLFTSTVVLFLSYAVIRIRTPDVAGISLGESLLCIWRGTQPYASGSSLPFKIPLQWIAIVMCCLYTGADYPVHDLGGFESHVIVASGSRIQWWLSRCCWVIACSLACFVVSSVPAVALTLVTGGGWGLSVRPEIAYWLGAGSTGLLGELAGGMAQDGDFTVPVDQQPWIDMGLSLAAIPALLAATMLVQLCISLKAGPTVAMVTCATSLFLTTLTGPWAALGITGGPTPLAFLMAGRTQALMRGGTDPALGVAVAAGIALVSVALGAAAFCRMDIMGRKGGA